MRRRKGARFLPSSLPPTPLPTTCGDPTPIFHRTSFQRKKNPFFLVVISKPPLSYVIIPTDVFLRSHFSFYCLQVIHVPMLNTGDLFGSYLEELVNLAKFCNKIATKEITADHNGY